MNLVILLFAAIACMRKGSKEAIHLHVVHINLSHLYVGGNHNALSSKCSTRQGVGIPTDNDGDINKQVVTMGN